MHVIDLPGARRFSGVRFWILICIMFDRDVAFSQQRAGVFGPRLDLQLGTRPIAVAGVNFPDSRVPYIAVLPEKKKEVRFYTLSPDCQLQLIRTVPLPFSATAMRTARSSTSAASDLILFSPHESVVGILDAGDETGGVATQRIPPDIQRFMVDDIDGDRRDDVLLYGRASSGIVTLLGGKNQTFKPWRTLFPDLSASDLITTDLNGDKIIDIFVADWLSNQVVLYSGIGQGIFSEQVATLLPGEPDHLALKLDRKRRVADLAVTIPDKAEIHRFTVSTLGEFRLEEVLRCPSRPTGVRFNDLDGNGEWETVTSVEGGIVVFPDGSEKGRRDPVLFASGGSLTSWDITDIDGDQRDDALLANREGQSLVILGNSRSSNTTGWFPVYSVGIDPRGITTGDFNGDAMTDVAVVNSSSDALSVLLNLGDGKLDGQRTVELPHSPMFVRATSAGPLMGATFIIAHAAPEQVSVVRWGANTTSSFTIPTGPNPYVLSPPGDSAGAHLSFITRTRNPRDGSVSLSMFEQIAGDQFIETSLKPTLPKAITALTYGDFTGDGFPDLGFATFDKPKKQSSLFFSQNTGRFEFESSKNLFTFFDTLGSITSIVSGLIDDDTKSDLLVSIAGAPGAVLLVYGKGDGTIRDSVQWIYGVQLQNEDACIIEDLNLDGITDLCFVDTLSKSIVAFYGIGKGKFRERVTICPAQNTESIRAAALKKAGVFDLVVAQKDKGSLSIIFDPFHP